MDRVRSLLAALDRSDFSVLGRLYLGPGRWLDVRPSTYLLILAIGAVWVAAVAWVAWRITRRGKPGTGGSAAAGGAADRQASRSLFAGALVLYLGVGAYVTFVYPPTTDEPHYLLLAESLVRDGDIALAGNYANGDYRRFYPVTGLDPHTVIVPGGEMYSQHTIGLPLAVLPGYAVAGRWGVLAILCAMGASLVAALYRLARNAGVNARSAWLTAILTAATAPLAFASTLVFTDVPAALLTAVALGATGSAWVPAVCAAGLPWLHPRFAVIAAGLLALNLLRTRSRGRTIGAWALAAVVSGSAFFAVYHGPALVSALNVLTERYPAKLEELSGATVSGNIAPRYALLGLLAKAFDRSFGVVPYAPWFILLIPGIFLAARRRRFPHVDLLVAGGAYAALTCLYRNWAGSAYPGRTVVALLPFLFPYLAAGVEWAGVTSGRRRALTLLVGVALATAWLLTAVPVLRYTSGRDWMGAKAGVAWRAMPFTWFPAFELQTAPPAPCCEEPEE
ncbi:MAG: hypothetical protein AAB152_09705 [Candidatus Coatesbacteria bacterium]